MAQCSELSFYRKLYGPSVLLKMNLVGALPQDSPGFCMLCRSMTPGCYQQPASAHVCIAQMQMYYLPSIPLLALSSMVDERLDDTFGEDAALDVAKQ
jgi:hypothetical protein